MHIRMGLIAFVVALPGVSGLAGREARPPSAPAADQPPDVALLRRLGVTLKVADRPRWPAPSASWIDVRLLPQAAGGRHVVSFAVPFGPGVLKDPALLRVAGPDGQEIPAFTEPLAQWWIDRKKGSVRSVLVQFEYAFGDASPGSVRIAWDRRPKRTRPTKTPPGQTQLIRRVEPPPQAGEAADAFDFHCPKVLALLPPEWLCASLLAWQQVPASANKAAPWFDKHLAEQFDGSLRYISANSRAYEAHLFDRAATYVKVYVRCGEAKHLLAAMQAGDFYVQHLGEDGFFDVKPGKDVKYVYSEGPALLYLLTGDDRYRQAVGRALRAWDRHRAVEYKGRGFWTERHHAFGMMAYLHAYEVSGSAEHLDKAGRYFDAAYAMQVAPVDGKPPDGAWVHSADSHGDGSGWTTSPWMSAFLADAIWKYWMLSGERRCPASLALYARFLARHAVTPDGKGVYYMANSPGRGKSEDAECPPHNMEAVYLLAMGYWLSGRGDAELLGKIRTLWPPILKDQANRPGRKFNWRFRETSMLVWFLAQAGVEGT